MDLLLTHTSHTHYSHTLHTLTIHTHFTHYSHTLHTLTIDTHLMSCYLHPPHVQTIKAAHIATVRKLAKPPHLIMRIMDCVLLLFGKRIDSVSLDPDRPCPKPSWSESLKVTVHVCADVWSMHSFNLIAECLSEDCANSAA